MFLVASLPLQLHFKTIPKSARKSVENNCRQTHLSRNLPGRFTKSIDADDAGRGAYHPATWNITAVAIGGKVRRENLVVCTFAPGSGLKLYNLKQQELEVKVFDFVMAVGFYALVFMALVLQPDNAQTSTSRIIIGAGTWDQLQDMQGIRFLSGPGRSDLV